MLPRGLTGGIEEQAAGADVAVAGDGGGVPGEEAAAVLVLERRGLRVGVVCGSAHTFAHDPEHLVPAIDGEVDLQDAPLFVAAEDLVDERHGEVAVASLEEDLLVDPLQRDLQDGVDAHAVGREVGAELVHVHEAMQVGLVEEELHDDGGEDRVAAHGDEVANVLQHFVEQRGLDLHHPRVIAGVGGIEREDDLTRLVVHQPPRHLGGQGHAVGGEVVDNDILLR